VACSYVSHYVHIVFGTKDRVHSIREEIQPKLWAYMAGIAKGHGIHAVAIGGFADHAHALIDLGAILGIAKAVQVLKANSSRWMKERVARVSNGNRDILPVASASRRWPPSGNML
jgi:putative transposase